MLLIYYVCLFVIVDLYSYRHVSYQVSLRSGVEIGAVGSFFTHRIANPGL